MQKGRSSLDKGPGYHFSHLNSLVGKQISQTLLVSGSGVLELAGTCSQKPTVRYSEICKLLVKPW